jgi:hypothetical protein
MYPLEKRGGGVSVTPYFIRPHPFSDKSDDVTVYISYPPL